MRILHLIDPDPCQAGACVLGLAADAIDRLDRHRHDVLIIGDTSRTRLAARCGIRPLGGIPAALERTALAKRGLARFLHADETVNGPYDLIHAWTMPAALVAATARPWHTIIAGPLTSPPGPSVSKRAIMRINRCAVRVLVATPALERDWTAVGVAPLLVTPQLPGVDRQRIAPEDRAMLRSRWGADETTFVVGLVGEPQSRVDTQTAVMAAVRIIHTARAVKLIVHHAAALRLGATKWVDQLGIGDLLVVEDDLAQPWTVAPGLDAALVVSRSSRTTPLRHAPCSLLAPLWTMAAGVPIIAGSNQTVADLLEDERSGLLVQHGDVNAIARGMLRLHDDVSLAHRLGNAGQQLVTSRFDAETFAKSLDDIYRQTVRGQRVVTKAEPACPPAQTAAKTAAAVTHH
ncbi:MAG: glycosyltransferase [Planctomycetes bacterium]|nr:glycosyltransferase [Planctomycetota bacterium]